MEDNNSKISLRNVLLDIARKNYEQSLRLTRIDFFHLYDSCKINNLVSEKIKEVQVYIDELDIEGLLKKLGYKLNTPRLKKAQVDFRLRQIMSSIIESKKFKKRIDKRFSISISTLFASSIDISSEELIIRELEELIRKIVIEELFYQVKKREYVLQNNILFEKKAFSKIKLILLRMMKYIKYNYKSITLEIIKDLIISVIANIIAKSINRRIKTPVIIFLEKSKESQM
ncbi:hypothetical protein [Clostridium pasteurianum]|uniref:Uncharacterized protein n=1 Tax=Clostridium pasteurianum BC1 TaxID=86416 RepID=R4K3A4_CLOPA|nr:hypothetical protein [Clostridium pasteurianum]AGK97602.1 hypothetical protein Clopa_2763 [Clostridium pasteurianum BC1]